MIFIESKPTSATSGTQRTLMVSVIQGQAADCGIALYFEDNHGVTPADLNFSAADFALVDGPVVFYRAQREHVCAITGVAGVFPLRTKIHSGTDYGDVYVGMVAIDEAEA